MFSSFQKVESRRRRPQPFLHAWLRADRCSNSELSDITQVPRDRGATGSGAEGNPMVSISSRCFLFTLFLCPSIPFALLGLRAQRAKSGTQD